MSSDELDRIGICLLDQEFLVMNFVEADVIFWQMMGSVVPGSNHLMERTFSEFCCVVCWKCEFVFGGISSVKPCSEGG